MVLSDASRIYLEPLDCDTGGWKLMHVHRFFFLAPWALSLQLHRNHPSNLSARTEMAGRFVSTHVPLTGSPIKVPFFVGFVPGNVIVTYVY